MYRKWVVSDLDTMHRLLKRFPLPVLIFMGLYLIAGLFLYRDFGMGWDEPMQRELGNFCLDFITGKNYGLYTMQNRFHGGAFETICALPEQVLHLEDTRQIYFSRHLVTFLFSWMGTVFFYLLAKRLLGNDWRYAFLALIIFVITPRIFSHSFYNSKDMPFLVSFVAAMYYMFRFIDRPGVITAVLLAFFTGFAIANRILGILVPVFTVFWLCWNIVGRRKSAESLWSLGIYLIILPVFTVMCWPVMWTEPFYNFTESIRMMSRFPFEEPTLFMGQFYKPADLPWYYVPVWIAISVPIAWQLLFLLGIILAMVAVFRDKKGIFEHWEWLACIGWFFGPWLMVVVLKSVIYDEWRHLFFTYPAFVLVGVMGWKWLNARTGFVANLLKFAGWAGILYQVIVALVFIIRTHPYEHVYFNVLAGKNIHLRYEMDYWGLSYREGWEYIAKTDHSDTIDIMWQTPAGMYSLDMLKPEDKKRLHPVNYLDCKYFVTHYRYYPTYPPEYKDKYYSVVVDGLEILTVFYNPYRKE